MIFERFLFDVVLKYLVLHHSATISDLFTAVSESRDPVSLPNFYKIIGQLCDRHVLVKRKSRLFLNMGWVVHYLDFAKDLQSYDYSVDDLHHLPIGKIHAFSGSSFQGIDSLYAELYLRLMQRTDEKTLYHYQSHFYHTNIFYDTEYQFWGGMKQLGAEHFFCCSGDTFLDRRGARFVSQFHNISIAHKVLDVFPREGYMTVVIGDWIVDCFLPYSLSQQFTNIFQSTQSEESFDEDGFLALFYKKTPLQLLVDHNPSRALSLKNLIHSCFPGSIKTL